MGSFYHKMQVKKFMNTEEPSTFKSILKLSSSVSFSSSQILSSSFQNASHSSLRCSELLHWCLSHSSDDYL